MLVHREVELTLCLYVLMQLSQLLRGFWCPFVWQIIMHYIHVFSTNVIWLDSFAITLSARLAEIIPVSLIQFEPALELGCVSWQGFFILHVTNSSY